MSEQPRRRRRRQITNERDETKSELGAENSVVITTETSESPANTLDTKQLVSAEELNKTSGDSSEDYTAVVIAIVGIVLFVVLMIGFVSSKTGKDGYVIVAALDEINEEQAGERKNQIDTGMYSHTTEPPLISESDSTDLYIITIADNVNFRRTPQSSGSSLGRIPFASSLILLGEESDGTYTWYKTNYNGQDGYVRSDMVQVLTSVQLQDYLAGEDTQPATKSNDYDKEYGYTANDYDKEYGYTANDYDYDKGYGYTAPNAGESLSEYIKRQDPQLYEDMRDNWNSLTGKDTKSATKSNDYHKQSSSSNYDRNFSNDEIQDFINSYNGKW